RETLKKRAFIRDRARRSVVVINPDHVRERVSEIKAAAIGTPRKRVGDSNSFSPGSRLAIRIDTNKNAVLSTGFAGGTIRIHVVAHRPDPQRSARIASRVVQADRRPSVKLEKRIVM